MTPTPQHPHVPPAVLQSHSSARLSLGPSLHLWPALPASPVWGQTIPNSPSPLPAHLPVFLDSVSPLSLPHHELFNRQERVAVAWWELWGTLG